MKMKQKLSIVLPIVALCLLLMSAAVPIQRHRSAGEIYHRYQGRDGLAVSFLKGYRIGDSVVVDVTVIAAADSAAWESLVSELNFSAELMARVRISLAEGRSPASMYFCRKGHPETHTGNEFPNSDYVMLSHADRSAFVFSLRTPHDVDGIIAHKSSEITHRNDNVLKNTI